MMYRIQATIILLLIAINTLFWCLPLFVCALVRAVSPAALRTWCTRRAMNIAECWISVNTAVFKLFGILDVEVASPPAAQLTDWHLVICNHQAWSDIFILQYVFNRRLPMLKFFIKDSLLYVPVIGIAWWVLDFPVMKRYSKEKLEKHPELRGKDQEATRKACENFKLTPVSVLNFLEGTRFTPAKHERLNSPYQRLLPPKVGGVSLVASALRDELESVTDVTIRYADGAPSLMAFLGGRGGKVSVELSHHSIPGHLPFDRYEEDPNARTAIKDWVHDIWLIKDEKLA